MKVCPKCNKEYDDNVTFCGDCGAALVSKVAVKNCPSCGKQADNPDAEYCQYCGKSLNEPAVTKDVELKEEHKQTQTSTPSILDRLFSTRMGRKDFCWRYLVANLCSAVPYYFYINGHSWAQIFFIVILAYCISLIVRRAHDANYSWGWTGVLCVLFFLPFLTFIILMCSKTYDGVNMWGA